MSKRCVLCGGEIKQETGDICYMCETNIVKGRIVVIRSRRFLPFLFPVEFVVASEEDFMKVAPKHNGTRVYWATGKIFKNVLRAFNMEDNNPIEVESRG